MTETHNEKKKVSGNNRGHIVRARKQALQDITKHQFETAPDAPWLCSRNESVGYHCWTATQLLKDTSITRLNRQLGIGVSPKAKKKHLFYCRE